MIGRCSFCCSLLRWTRRFHSTVVPGSLVSISSEVKSALSSGKPVLALETTILTHGMPYPDNVLMAVQVEDIARSHEVTPATIGVVDGRVCIGLSNSQLEQLGKPSKQQKFKVSRRDLAYVLSQGQSGGTTVSGTMVCAHQAGIPLFVTGGLGGVHREGEKSLDVSADLTELGRTPVGVVCGGVKSILDIGRTLEYLETQGVTVATYGDSKVFPAFFSPKSSHEAPYSVSNPLEAAKMIDANLTFGLGSGLVIGVPIPSDELSDDIEQAIQKALLEAKEQGVTGKAITPFLLERVNQITEGRSLEANIKLIKNNVKVGSQIAVELTKLRSERTRLKRSTSPKQSSRRQPVVIGASILDCTAKVATPEIKREGTNPGSLSQTFGGVGRNIADCMSRLGSPPLFISSVGRDGNGQKLLNHLTELGMSPEGVHKCEQLPTATYCAVLDGHGEMYCGVGDMNITQTITKDMVGQFTDQLAQSSMVCLDGNLPLETIKFVCSVCSEAGVPVWYEPTCVDKAVKPILAECHSQIAYSSPNLAELRSMYSTLTGKSTNTQVSSELSLKEKLSECVALAPSLLAHTPHLIVSLGQHGVLYCSAQGYLHYRPAADELLPVSVVSVTGAGDSFVGAAIVSLINGLPLDLSIKAGLRAAYGSLHSHHAVSTELNPDWLIEQSIQNWASWEPTVVQV